MRTLFLVCCLGLVGCVVGSESEPTGVIQNTSNNKLALNSLGLNKLALNKLALNKLALGRLDEVTLEGSDALVELERATADGDRGYSSLVAYVARCALPDGQAIETPLHRYPGSIGVAAEWATTGTCDVACQEWMTACLLAHVNKLEVEVPISLRGEHAALAPSTLELEHFTDQEAAFYGNLFAGQSSEPGAPLQNVYACTGWAVQRDAALIAQSQQNPGGPQWVANATLAKRLCGRTDGGQDACPGIKVVGSCGYFPIWTGFVPQACDGLIGENPSGPAAGTGVYYGRCYQTAGTVGLRFSPPFQRVITTFLDTRGSGYEDAP